MPALERHAFAVGFIALTVAVCLALTLLPARQATRSFDTPRSMIALFPPGEPARASRDTIREVGALPRQALLGGTLVSFVAWHPQQIERLEQSGALALALPSRPNFTLGCVVTPP